MNNKSKIALLLIFGAIGIVYAAYLFVLPNLIDLNSFKPQIITAAEEATGLKVDPGTLKLRTFYDFSVQVSAQGIKVSYPNGKPLLNLEKAEIRASLPPLLFRKLEIEEVTLLKPRVSLTGGELPKPPAPAKAELNPEKPEKSSEPLIEPVFAGMRVHISDYKVTGEHDLILEGDLIEISKFNPDRFIELVARGRLLVGGNPNINYDIRLASQLPLVEPAKKETQPKNPEKSAAPAKPSPKTDPVARIIKYDPKINLKADLKLKRGRSFPEIRGILNFDGLSLKIDGERLPDSHGKFNFSGKNIAVDSKLFVTPASFIEIAGKISDMEKQDFDINVKSTDIDLKDVKKFAYSLADAANADAGALDTVKLSGRVKADFNLQKNNFQGYLNVLDTTVRHRDLPQPLKNLTSRLKFDKDKVLFEETTGYLGDIGFNITGHIDSGLSADIKAEIPDFRINTIRTKTKILARGRLDMEKPWNILAISDIEGLEYINGPSVLKINAKCSPESMYINRSGLFSGEKHLISIEGSINDYKTFNDVKVGISGLDIIFKEPKGRAKASGNFVISGNTDTPKALGTITLNNINLPEYFLEADSITVELKDEEITVNTGVLTVLGSRAKFAATLVNKLTPPYVVNSVEINSGLLDIDKLTQAAQQKPARARKIGTAAPVQTPAHMREQPDIPLMINNGRFFAEQLIVNRLQNRDLSFNFTLKPLNILRIRDFTTHTAGGKAFGKVDMNLKTTKLDLDFTADNLEINALATIFANMPNEIFGGMKGRIKLSTIGHTPELMVQNALGKADFNIKDGHLGKLGNLGYLLKTGSINFGEADKTNHFDRLDGHVLINRGTMEVQELSTQGKYLSSFTSGTIRIIDNNADLTVLGRLSGKIVRQLGPIADISVDKLVRKIPGKWGQLLADARLTNQYPNRDRIPALNAEPLEMDRDFAVKIRGNLKQPYSVRLFEWLSPQ